MNAIVLSNPDLSLQIGENEVGRIPFGATVTFLNWDVDDTWASVEYQGTTGYVPKRQLQRVGENTSSHYQLNQKTKANEDYSNVDTYSLASYDVGRNLPYLVIQVTLKEKVFGTGSRNLEDLEEVINNYYQRGYRLHTMSTSESSSKGGMLGDRIQATLVFEKANLFK